MIPLRLLIFEYSINNVLLLVYYDSVEKIMVQGIKVPAAQRRWKGIRKDGSSMLQEPSFGYPIPTSKRGGSRVMLIDVAPCTGIIGFVDAGIQSFDSDFRR